MADATLVLWGIKATSVLLGTAAVAPSMRARRIRELNDGGREDRRRRYDLASYILTSFSILLFCVVGFLQ